VVVAATTLLIFDGLDDLLNECDSRSAKCLGSYSSLGVTQRRVHRENQAWTQCRKEAMLPRSGLLRGKLNLFPYRPGEARPRNLVFLDGQRISFGTTGQR
jgi:hypothetical protein